MNIAGRLPAFQPSLPDSAYRGHLETSQQLQSKRLQWSCLSASVCLLFLFALLVPSPLHAQMPEQTTFTATANVQPLFADRGAAGLWQTLQKLHTRASLMMITAHPDDEDGGMLTYESRGQGVRVSLLTLNRGEGGQNVMSDNYWDQLGLLRTQELLAAGRYYGVQQYWSRVADFGFSKTREESLRLWGYDRVLYDVVRAIRIERPLVLTSVFVGGITDGHGQHQVAGQMTQEAFRAAYDPNVFPDQIKAGLLPWKPLKVYARVPMYSISAKGMFDYATGQYAPVRFYDYVAKQWSINVPATNIVVPEGTYDPLLGASYFQFARQGLGMQKSQNGGTGIPFAGQVDVPYHRYGSVLPAKATESSYFDGIDTSLAGIATLATGTHPFLVRGLEQINTCVNQAMQHYSAANPENIAPELASGLRSTQALIEQVQQSNLTTSEKYNILHELNIKRVQFNTALVEALAITLRATVDFPPQASSFTTAVPGQAFPVTVRLNQAAGASLAINSITLHAPAAEHWKVVPEAIANGSLQNNHPAISHFNVTVGAEAQATQAYFHRNSLEQPYYDIDQPQYLNQSLPPYPLQAWAKLTYDGVTLRLGQDVQTAQKITGYGEIFQPLVIAPAISVGITPHAGILPLGSTGFMLTVKLHSNVKGAATGSLHLQLPNGWTSKPAAVAFQTGKDGEDQNICFDVVPLHPQEKPYAITAVADYAGKHYTTGYVTVGYPSLRPYNFYRPATYKTTGVDIKVAAGLRVGYIMGSGDEVPQSLEDLGIHVHQLSAEEIASSNLQQFDVLVLGIRAYAARPELAHYNAKLLDYVHSGGVVIVQYNTNEYDHNFGPYPYTMGRLPEKVIDETAPVQLLAPQNPLLSWPNKISAKDFSGWVEERGHSFLQSWDNHYQPLTKTHDPGQTPQEGGLLYARYGRGAYVYVAYALYRQLPEGVPGAYRLFANMLSLPKALDHQGDSAEQK